MTLDKYTMKLRVSLSESVKSSHDFGPTHLGEGQINAMGAGWSHQENRFLKRIDEEGTDIL